MAAMTGVLGRPYLARQDIAVAVGTTQRIGFRWFRATDRQGTDREPVDLSAHTGVVRLESSAGDGWVEFEPLLHVDGLVEVVIEPAMTAGPEWVARDVGRWSVTVAAPSGETTCVATGVVRIVRAGGL